MFDKLLQRIRPRLAKQNTWYRQEIGPDPIMTAIGSGPRMTAIRSGPRMTVLQFVHDIELR